MNIKLIAVSAVGAAVLAAGGFVGYKKFVKHDKSEKTPVFSEITRPEAVYETSEKTHYDALDYSFDISNDFERSAPKELKEGYTGKYMFSNDKVKLIEIKAGGRIDFPAEKNAKLTYEELCKDENIADVSLEEIPLGDFSVYAYHYRRVKSSTLENDCVSCYSASYQGREFTMDAWYSRKNKDEVLPMLDDIARSLVYTSDYRLPTEPFDFDCKYFSVKGADPMWYIYEHGETDSENGRLSGISCTIAMCDELKDMMVRVRLERFKPGSDIPRKLADNAYLNIKDKNSESITVSGLERGSGKVFGCDAETVNYTMEMTSGGFRKREFWFEKDGNVYDLSLVTDVGDTSLDDAIDELIGKITIK